MIWPTLPVPEPTRLVNLVTLGEDVNWNSHSLTGEGNFDEAFSYPMFRDLEKTQTVFTGIAAHRLFNANLIIRGEASRGLGLLVSGSYFPVLGVRASLGRLLGPEDDGIMNEPHVVVLSHAYWQTRFGGDPK